MTWKILHSLLLAAMRSWALCMLSKALLQQQQSTYSSCR